MKIVAVTACAVGLAHTYMAAASLKKAAKDMGVDIKVETQGSMGIRDRIKPDEITDADVLILAADIAILEPERFKGIPTLNAPTNKVIRKAKDFIQQAIDLINA